MREPLRLLLCNASCLEDMARSLVAHLAEMRAEHPQMGFVSGVISSAGEHLIVQNIARLARFADHLSVELGMPVFCAAFVFTSQHFERLPQLKLPREEREPQLVEFWRIVLRSGYVTDLFMTPGWEASAGAVDEHVVAQEVGGIKIHYLKFELSPPPS